MDMVEIEIQVHKIINGDATSEKWIEELMHRGREVVKRIGNNGECYG